MSKEADKAMVIQEPVQIEPLLSIPDVMRMLGLGRDTIYRLIREEGLPALKLGARQKVVPSSLANWIKQREQSTLPSPESVNMGNEALQGD